MAGKLGQKSTLLTEVPESYQEDFLAGMDRRSRVARVLRQRLVELQTDLGGADSISYARRSLCKRAVHIEAVIEAKEEALARGDEVDLGPYVQAVNSLIGLYKTLGLERCARDVSLGEYLRDEHR